MYAIEFQAPIENGIVHIPKKYKEIHDTKKATFVVMYDDEKATKSNTVITELTELFANSNNSVQVTMELATNTDEMMNDGIL